ncbi:hypothetical protein MTO96_023119 [Rhipicephalus appendiculatus]
MASAARPCVQDSSVDELPNPDACPQKTKRWPQLLFGQRMSPRCIVVPLLLVFFPGFLLFPESMNVPQSNTGCKRLTSSACSESRQSPDVGKDWYKRKLLQHE